MNEADHDVLSVYDGWTADGGFSTIGNTTCVKRRYVRDRMWADVWLEPMRNWRGDQPGKEIRRQLDRAKEHLEDFALAREYARMC